MFIIHVLKKDQKEDGLENNIQSFLCPSCNKWYNCPKVPELQNLINENKKLYDEIYDMSIKRLV